MKGFFSVFAMIMFGGAAIADVSAVAPVHGRGRASLSNQMMGAPRAVASKNQISAAAMAGMASVKVEPVKATVTAPEVKEPEMAVKPEEMKPAEKKDMREKEKLACTSNNIGIGNTFVWASRYSNLGSYATMIEDVEEPENNICFVKVELKSTDPRISVADIPSKYYEMGEIITCGTWANEKTLEDRILDAKKSARTWATVGGAVGGAAVGVGAMELFGNKLIGGAVQGQKQFKEGSIELLRSQLAVLKKDNEAEYKRFMRYLRELRTECANPIWKDPKAVEYKPEVCEDYAEMFEIL